MEVAVSCHDHRCLHASVTCCNGLSKVSWFYVDNQTWKRTQKVSVRGRAGLWPPRSNLDG